MRTLAATTVLLIAVAGCDGRIPFSGETATVPIEQGYGPNPTLPPPNPTWIPTVNIAPANPWPEGTAPTPAPGLEVNEFAGGLDHPRWLHVLPNGDVLVAESNAPPKPEEEFSASRTGSWGWSCAGPAPRCRAPTASRCCATPTATASPRSRSAVPRRSSTRRSAWRWSATTLYVANTDAMVRFPYQEGATEITAPGEKLADLPGGPINHHWTKNVIASPDGTQALRRPSAPTATSARTAWQAEENRAAMLEIDLATGDARVFASGLAQPERPRLAARQRRALGRRSTSATRSAATSCPTT